ncbi:MAG: NAD-dependent epimerase/dehydratase family protein [Rhodanobacter sp.]
MSEKVLLAGCGDLGLRVANLLLQRGDEVWALRRTPPTTGGDGIHWIGADLTQPQTLRQLPTDLTQLVYLPAPDRRDACTYGALFADGLRNLLVAEGLATLQRVLLVTSSAVYGDHAGAWVDEDTPTAPLAFNGTLLRDVEQWLAAQPVRSIVLRLAGIYGPGRLQLLERLRTGSVMVPRETPHWANRVHVDDAATAVAHLLQLAQPLPIYLGVDDTPLPLHVLYDYLAELIDAPLPANGPAPASVGSKRLSNARLRASGWAPRWPDARAGYADLVRQ